MLGWDWGLVMAFPLVLQLFQVVEYRTSIILHLCDSSTYTANSFLLKPHHFHLPTSWRIMGNFCHQHNKPVILYSCSPCIPWHSLACLGCNNSLEKKIKEHTIKDNRTPQNTVTSTYWIQIPLKFSVTSFQVTLVLVESCPFCVFHHCTVIG